MSITIQLLSNSGPSGNPVIPLAVGETHKVEQSGLHAILCEATCAISIGMLGMMSEPESLAAYSRPVRNLFAGQIIEVLP